MTSVDERPPVFIHFDRRLRVSAFAKWLATEAKSMGVSIRDRNKGGISWVFVRYKAQRVSEQIGSEMLPLEAKIEIERDIRLGRYDIAKVKTARAPDL